MRDRPVLVQIVALVAIAVALATLLMFAITFNGPPPRPAPVRYEEVARALVSGSGQWGLKVDRTAAAPQPTSGEVPNPASDARIAAQIGVPSDRVRGFYELPGRGPDFARAELRGHFSVGLRGGDGWTVARSERPFFTRWHAYVLGGMGLILIVLAALAALVGRAIVLPLTRLADAADRMETMGGAAAPVEGPPEVRRVGQALNAMHGRIAADVQLRTDMLVAIAHDMGTPLTRLAFHAEKLDEATRLRAVAEIDIARRMIGSVLDYARGQQRGSEAVALRPLLEAVAKRGGDVLLAPEVDVAVTGDALALTRLFANIVDNALRYAGAARVKIAEQDGRALVTIDDDGPGLDPALLPRLFDPFVRGEKSRNAATGGTGLGLAIARQIAEAHGGSVAAENRAPGGARFTVSLPLA